MLQRLARCGGGVMMVAPSSSRGYRFLWSQQCAPLSLAAQRTPSHHGVAIVTGGTEGIGRACVDRLRESGRYRSVYNLDIAGRSSQASGHGEEGLNGGCSETFIETDMGSEDSVRAAISAIIDCEGQIDVLVNNVGIQPPESCVPLHELPSHHWDQILAVNLSSAYYASKYTLPVMMKTAKLFATREGGKLPTSTGSPGVVVNMASVQGVLSQECVPAYAAAKGGMLSLTRQMAIDYGSYGIRVVAVNPGTISTPLVQSLIEGSGKSMADAGSVYPLEKRVGRPQEVGDTVLFLCSPAASFISGSHIDVDGAICIKGGWNT